MKINKIMQWLSNINLCLLVFFIFRLTSRIIGLRLYFKNIPVLKKDIQCNFDTLPIFDELIHLSFYCCILILTYFSLSLFIFKNNGQSRRLP